MHTRPTSAAAVALLIAIAVGALAMFMVDVRPRLQRHRAADSDLERRVRAELRRWVLHPQAIEIRARDGFVQLRGSVLAAERAQLERAVEGVPGVLRVAARVAAHDSPDSLPLRTPA